MTTTPPPKKKLVVNRQTLRELTPEENRRVVGGTFVPWTTLSTKGGCAVSMPPV